MRPNSSLVSVMSPNPNTVPAGNLSQERVSKRDVWDLFHPCGRLAQISLKNAYGFVQYHTLPDAETAMKTLQGAEVKGRKIRTSITTLLPVPSLFSSLTSSRSRVLS